MTTKLGTLLLLAASAATMSAQTPSAVADIYSQTGTGVLGDGGQVVYSVGSWHAGGTDDSVSLWPALFEEMLGSKPIVLVSGVFADAEGIEMSWNNVEKLITINCEPELLGHTNVLIADVNGATRGMVAVNENPAKISLSNHVAGAYVIACAVDGKLVKTFKIILK